MDLPIALDASLKALLASHEVSSWKIAAERQNLTVIVRLKPVTVPSVYNNGVPQINTVAFRRKSPSQMQRDRQRMQTFRQRDCVQHVYVPRANGFMYNQNAALVNEHSIIQSESHSDTPSVVDDKDIDSGSRPNDETRSLASAPSIAGTCEHGSSDSDKEASDAESGEDSAESETATLPSPITDSRTSAGTAEVSSEDTARNAVTPASRADQRTEDGAHGGVESEPDTGSLSLQKYVCQVQRQETPPGKGQREGEGEREKKISDTSVRRVNLQDSGVESLHVRDESNVTFGNDEVGGIGAGGQLRGGEGRGRGMREVSLEACDNTVYDGNMRFPHSQTDIHQTPMTIEDQWTLYDEQYERWYNTMAAQQVIMPACGPYPTYPPYPAPLPAPLPMMPTLHEPPVSLGCGEGLNFGGPSVGVSKHHDCDTAFVECETFGKKERENAKGMNEERVEQCTKGGKMWSSVVKKSPRNNEMYGRERTGLMKREDDRYRGGRGYRGSERFRGRGGLTRWARDYHDGGAKY